MMNMFGSLPQILLIVMNTYLKKTMSFDLNRKDMGYGIRMEKNISCQATDLGLSILWTDRNQGGTNSPIEDDYYS